MGSGVGASEDVAAAHQSLQGRRGPRQAGGGRTQITGRAGIGKDEDAMFLDEAIK